MSKITWPNRTDLKTAIGATYEWAAAIANEVKTSVNALYSDKNTWYLSVNGDNNNIGSTKAEPFRNIQNAHDAASDGDTLELLGLSYVDVDGATITKALNIVGVKPILTGGFGGATLAGTWIISNNTKFRNISFSVDLEGSATKTLEFVGCDVKIQSTTNRNFTILLAQSHSTIYTNADFRGFRAIDSQLRRFASGQVLTVGRWIELFGSDTIDDFNIIAGIDFSSTVKLYGSTIIGDLTVTGDLEKTNSIVVGTETVSGSTTDTQQTQRETIKIPLGARDTAHTTGTNKVGLHIDYNFTFIGLPTLEFDPIITDGGPTGNAFVVDINVADIDGANEASILSTKLSVDAGEFHSSTAATPCVLSSNTIAKYKFISIDIDTIGGTLAGKGGYVTFPGYRT